MSDIITIIEDVPDTFTVISGVTEVIQKSTHYALLTLEGLNGAGDYSDGWTPPSAQGATIQELKVIVVVEPTNALTVQLKVDNILSGSVLVIGTGETTKTESFTLVVATGASVTLAVIAGSAFDIQAQIKYEV